MFLTYLDDWEKSVEERPGPGPELEYSASEKLRMLISAENQVGPQDDWYVVL